MAISSPHRQAGRHRDRHHSITFRGQADAESSGWPRSVWALAAIGAFAPFFFAGTYVVDQFSRNLLDAYCSDSIDPACAEDAEAPVVVVGVLCALVFLGCAGTIVVILVRRQLARRRHGGAPSL